MDLKKLEELYISLICPPSKMSVLSRISCSIEIMEIIYLFEKWKIHFVIILHNTELNQTDLPLLYSRRVLVVVLTILLKVSNDSNIVLNHLRRRDVDIGCYCMKIWTLKTEMEVKYSRMSFAMTLEFTQNLKPDELSSVVHKIFLTLILLPW